MKPKDIDFVERRTAANAAKAALLEKAKAKASDPTLQARRAEHAAAAAARSEREQQKREEAERRKREEAERLAADKAAAEEAKQLESNRLVARLLEDEVARKAERDARYAARKARKK